MKTIPVKVQRFDAWATLLGFVAVYAGLFWLSSASAVESLFAVVIVYGATRSTLTSLSKAILTLWRTRNGS